MPGSLKQAASLLSKYNGKARINAGGTDLIGELRDHCIAEYPEALINIKTISNLDYIKASGRGLRIGALAKLADIVKSPVIKQDYSLLAEAALSIANPNLRNMATVGGNLAQDVRCWYYRYSAANRRARLSACAREAKPAARWSAITAITPFSVQRRHPTAAVPAIVRRTSISPDTCG